MRVHTDSLPDKVKTKDADGPKVEHLYVYRTGERPDGLEFAVGVMYTDGKTDGAYALFRTWEATARFVESESSHLKVKCHFLSGLNK